MFLIILPTSPSVANAAIDGVVGGVLDGVIEDEVWLINTRCITADARCADLELPPLATFQYDGHRSMLPADLDSLVQMIRGDAIRRNVIYIHGNNFEADEAIERAWLIRNKIRCKRSGNPPMRFIIFSWPSETVTTPLKDIRVKADRTDAQGLYLAHFLRTIIDAPQPVTLIGYSFGGRVATGALHALAGGALDNRRLPGPHVTGFNAKLALIAPALDRDWLLAGEYHGRATKNIERIALMYNPRDQVLRRYWLLEPGGLRRALGTAGPMRYGPRADGTPVPLDSHDCSRTVGRRHKEEDYYSADCNAGGVVARLIDHP